MFIMYRHVNVYTISINLKVALPQTHSTKQ